MRGYRSMLSRRTLLYVRFQIICLLKLSDWPTLSRVNKQLAHLFRQDLFWTAALSLHVNPWPGPIPQAFTNWPFHFIIIKSILLLLLPLTFVSGDIANTSFHSVKIWMMRGNILEESGEPDLAQNNVPSKTAVRNKEDDEIKELRQQWNGDNMKVGMPASCNTFMADNLKEINEKGSNDQFIACGKSRDTAHELASTIWLAVVDNLEENEHTFNLLNWRIFYSLSLNQTALVILPFPYSRSYDFH
ncbi:hypothetical protein CQW23_11344 [Capsicum baccatum]|uniref:Uncharacterized protein n=1 Tax=Capsicum baccatum TaxID=33114 RepID=A0A2G2WPG5_CAPBA|nr:hypothetical protein CQW23_11344 [Capsicum baccatum]